jgi:hypothetical protein
MLPSVEDYFCDLESKISRHCSEHELNETLDKALSLCDDKVADMSPAQQVAMFCEVAYALEKLPGNHRIWSWLRQTAKGADIRKREAMRIAIFELVPEEPVREDDLISLWSFIEEPATRWVVRDSYMHQIEKIQSHYAFYLDNCGKNGKQMFGLDVLTAESDRN